MKNEHLKSLRELHDALLIPRPEPETNQHLSDMDIVSYQALLMETGSEVLKALKAGEITEILVALVNLAYTALAAIARQGGEIIDAPGSWQHDWSILAVMKVVSDKINQCTSGNTDQYSALYYLCSHLARDFINADFNKAFQMTHAHNISRVKTSGESFYGDADNIRKLKLQKSPDLTECLYE